DYFFPKNCLNCHKEGVWLCESCKDSLFFIDARFCPFCGELTEMFSVCKRCQEKTKIKKVFPLFKYSDSLIQKIIKSFKYRYLQDIAEDLAPTIRKFLLKYNTLVEVKEGTAIIPVPLHWYRKCSRGFNQAEELAEIVGRILNLKIEKDIVIKTKKSKNQANVEFEKRFINLKGAFSLQKKAPKNVIIIDDVFTTGSTVGEIAGILTANGTENIQVITLARG
ncbi:ComF family protein, partial [Patescibacteria group bacterium]|nr:ComF family protein [Patescibacteria group bacterium]